MLSDTPCLFCGNYCTTAAHYCRLYPLSPQAPSPQCASYVCICCCVTACVPEVVLHYLSRMGMTQVSCQGTARKGPCQQALFPHICCLGLSY